MPYKKIEKYLEDKKKDPCFGSLSNDKFASLIRNLLVSEHGYVTDTGTNAQVNLIILEALVEKVKAHPKLWKWFFMVA